MQKKPNKIVNCCLVRHETYNICIIQYLFFITHKSNEHEYSLKKFNNIDVFNGDTDGICALNQYRLAYLAESELVTGVKLDLSL